jgi:hypothetical protein
MNDPKREDDVREDEGPDDEASPGQVSEVQSMPAADDAEISDSQGVAGNPEAPDIGEAGPNASPYNGDPEH